MKLVNAGRGSAAGVFIRAAGLCAVASALSMTVLGSNPSVARAGPLLPGRHRQAYIYTYVYIYPRVHLYDVQQYKYSHKSAQPRSRMRGRVAARIHKNENGAQQYVYYIYRFSRPRRWGHFRVMRHGIPVIPSVSLSAVKSSAGGTSVGGTLAGNRPGSSAPVVLSDAGTSPGNSPLGMNPSDSASPGPVLSGSGSMDIEGTLAGNSLGNSPPVVLSDAGNSPGNSPIGMSPSDNAPPDPVLSGSGPGGVGGTLGDGIESSGAGDSIGGFTPPVVFVADTSADNSAIGAKPADESPRDPVATGDASPARPPVLGSPEVNDSPVPVLNADASPGVKADPPLPPVAVPEPASFLLLGTALALFLGLPLARPRSRQPR